jgi:hypothetical protein
MSRPPKHPLRPLTQDERTQLEALAHSRSAPADQLVRAKEILAVASGADFTHAASEAGRHRYQAVAELVLRFNREGMSAIYGHHGGGPAIQYGPEVSTYVILQVLHQAGYTWQQDRTWCDTGTVERKRKDGVVKVSDPHTAQKRGRSSRRTL